MPCRLQGRGKRRLAASASLLALSVCVPGLAQDAGTGRWGGGPHHVLYVDSNVVQAGRNSILAYDIAPDGSLHALPGSPFLTGGTGFYDSSFKLGPFDNDQQVILNPAGTVLYAVNGGSNTIAAFQLDPAGQPIPLPGSPYSAQGSTPVSLGLHQGTLVAVDSGEDPAQAVARGGTPPVPKLSVSRVGYDRRLAPEPRAAFPLPAGADPTQALTTGTGAFVFSSEFPGGGNLLSFLQTPDGRLLQAGSLAPPLVGGTQAAPLGLWTSPTARYLYVGFVNPVPGLNKVGVYSWDNAGTLSFVRMASNSGSATCWLRTTRDGRRLYTANTGDQSISVYDTSDPANPVEIQHLSAGGVGGYEEFSLDPEERFLYVLEQENSPASVGRSNKVHVLQVDKGTGLLAALDALTVTLPVPAGTRPIGVAIR